MTSKPRLQCCNDWSKTLVIGAYKLECYQVEHSIKGSIALESCPNKYIKKNFHLNGTVTLNNTCVTLSSIIHLLQSK